MEPIRILVVEDDAIIGLGLKMQLEQLGYVVPGLAVDAADGERKALALRPDLILADIKLQGEVDGIEMVRRIRSRCSVPVIFLTAYDMDGIEARAAAVGNSGFLVKPVDFEELQRRLEALCPAAHADPV